MPFIIEKYIKKYSNSERTTKIFFKKFLKKIKFFLSYYINFIKVKIDIEISKIELRKKHYNLGRHIANKNINDYISDFTYEDEYNHLIQEIKSLELYIKNLKNDKIKI